MMMSYLPSPSIMTAFAVHNPICIAETSIAHIWQVTRMDGRLAALKSYKNDDLQDESAGFDLLQAWNGRGAAQLYARHDSAVLLEWLGGDGLGDLVRAGKDVAATRVLVDVANALHATSIKLSIPLPSLTAEFDALRQATFANDCPAQTRHTLQTAQRLAADLLASQTDLRPLHRDLHHDNIKGSARGYLAFDAKGVIGERAFELANAFRNPLDAEATYSDPAVITRRLGVWSQAFAVDPKRLLQWAAANSALSLAWTHKRNFGPEVAKDAALIDTFLSLV